jgi:hypothetical protein
MGERVGRCGIDGRVVAVIAIHLRPVREPEIRFGGEVVRVRVGGDRDRTMPLTLHRA